MKHFVKKSIFIAVFLTIPITGYAQTANQQYISALQQLIQLLTQQVQILQTQLQMLQDQKSLVTGSVHIEPTITPTNGCYGIACNPPPGYEIYFDPGQTESDCIRKIGAIHPEGCGG